MQSREVALKFFKFSESLGIGFPETMREFILQSWVDHPHILSVRGFGILEVGWRSYRDEDKIVYATTDLASGGSLLDSMDRDEERSIIVTKKFPKEDVVTIIYQAAQALDALHRAGIAHRDVAPRNFFLERPLGEGPINVKLGDFGFSTLLPGVSLADTALGNPFLVEDLKEYFRERNGPWHCREYEQPDESEEPDEPSLKEKIMEMIKTWVGKQPQPPAPERSPIPENTYSLAETVTPDNRRLAGTNEYYAAPEAFWDDRDGKADQYSLGVIAHQLLKGRLPMKAYRGRDGWTQRLDYWEIPERGLSKDLHRVLKRCLAYSPEDRFPTAVDFAENLANALGVELPKEKPDPPKTAVREASFAGIDNEFDAKGYKTPSGPQR